MRPKILFHPTPAELLRPAETTCSERLMGWAGLGWAGLGWAGLGCWNMLPLHLSPLTVSTPGWWAVMVPTSAMGNADTQQEPDLMELTLDI